MKITNFVVSSLFKNQHSGRCPRFCHPKVSNFPSGCFKTTKWVTESTNGCSKTTKWVIESTNGDPISTKWVPPKIQNGVRQLYEGPCGPQLLAGGHSGLLTSSFAHFARLTLSGAGVWRLNLGRGGVKNTPPLYIDVSTAIAPKMVPNLISRQD